MRTIGSTLRRTRQRRNRMRAYWKTVARFKALGLTSKGTPRKYQLYDFPHRGLKRKAFRSRLYRKRLIDQGLSTASGRYGLPRKQHQYHLPRTMPARAKQKLYDQRFLGKRYAQGLTARGTARKLNRPSAGIFLLSEHERAWREFRRTIAIPETPELYTWADRAQAA